MPKSGLEIGVPISIGKAWGLVRQGVGACGVDAVAVVVAYGIGVAMRWVRERERLKIQPKRSGGVHIQFVVSATTSGTPLKTERHEAPMRRAVGVRSGVK